MDKGFRSILTACLVMVAVVAAPVPASADESAVLKGKVIDFSGKAIKKVSIVLTSADDPSIRFKVKSDKNGLFEISVKDGSLSYEAEFERSSYVSMSTAVELSAGETAERTFTMLTQQEVAEGKAEILRERELPKEDPAMDLYNDGVTAFTAGDLVTARKRFEAALEYDDSMLQALSALSLITMQQQKWDDALAYATRTLAIEPTDLRGLFASYRANKFLGNDAEAAIAAAALTSTGHSRDVAGQTFNEGVDLYKARKATQAVKLFEQAAELDPTMADAHIVLAGLYLNRGNFKKSLAASDQALALIPDNTKALTYRFEACLRGNNEHLPEAITALGAVDPAYVSKAVNAHAFNLFEDNKNAEAKKLVEQLLVLDPNDARANYVMGLILVNAGDNATARKHLQTFVDTAPDDPDAAGARSMMEALR